MVGDVGLYDFEEVNVVSKPGMNFGWADVEGPCVPQSEADGAGGSGSARCDEFQDPTTYFTHDSDDAFVLADPEATAALHRVVWVSSTYQGGGEVDPYVGALDDKLLFGDSCTGFARMLEVDQDGAAVTDSPIGHLGPISSVRQHGDGYLYALRMAGCTSEETGTGAFVRLTPKAPE